jgi:hypothetical protein
MNVRARLRRSGAALIVAGLFLSTVDVNPAGEIPGARAAESTVASEPVTAGVSTSATPRAPKGGDLTHLEFTASDGLVASLVSPADDEVAAATAASVEVQTVKGAGVEIKVGDAVVPFSRIGKRTVDTKTGVTTYTYYGIALQPGPNTLALTPLGANGVRGATTTHRVFGPGRPVTLAISATGPFRADGTSADQIRVEARDAWGHRAASGSSVQVVLVSGDARLERVNLKPPSALASSAPDPSASAAPDAQASPRAQLSPVPMTSSSPGPNVAISQRQTLDVLLDADGCALVRLIPGITPGDVILRADAGDVSRDARFFLAPNLRKPFVSGLVTAGAGAVPGIPDAPDGMPDGTNARRGRIAMFGTGALGKSLATFAYDTSNTLRSTPGFGGAHGTYDGDPNDRPFAITGDSSTRRDDALSRDHLFARFDSGRATAMWGEFHAVTGSTTNGLGGFDQLVDGAKLELAGNQRRMSVFAAKNSVGYDRRVFAPSGLATGVTLRSSIVVGSETIVLATIDRRTGAILTQTALTRGVDYTVEYATGQLRFIEVPLPFDQAFNPQQIVVTYQFDAPGNAARTVGGRAETTFGRNHAIKLGVGYVNDTSGAGNVSLATQDLGGQFRGGSWSIVHATSHGALLSTGTGEPIAGDGGSALHAQLNRAAGPDRLSLTYDRTGVGYNDPFGGLSAPGLLNERLTYVHRYAGGAGDVALDVGHQANVGVGLAGNQQTTASLRTRRALTKRFAVTASIDRRVSSTNATNPTALPTALPFPGATGFIYQPVQSQPAEASTQASIGFDWRATNALSFSANRLQTLAGTNDVQPAQTDAQLTYDLGKGGRAYIRERWSASPVQSFAAATQAYTAPTGGTRATEIGLQRRLGNATTFDTSYVVDHTATGSDVYATIGVRERIAIGRTHGDAFLQHGTSTGTSLTSGATGANGAVAGTAGGFNLYGLSLSYGDPANRFRASGAAQLRTGDGAGVSLSLAALGAISPDFSLFASINDARSTSGNQSDERIGLAWRPSRSDFGVTLLQYDRRDGTGPLTNTQSGVLSLEQVLRVRSRTEIVGRYAYKLDGDSYYAAHSSLAGLRLDQRIGSRFDVGAEVRRASVRGIDGATATALAVETGLRLGNQTRVGIGYNMHGTADPSLSSTPAHRGAYVTVTSVVDRLFGWGRP